MKVSASSGTMPGVTGSAAVLTAGDGEDDAKAAALTLGCGMILAIISNRSLGAVMANLR